MSDQDTINAMLGVWEAVGFNFDPYAPKAPYYPPKGMRFRISQVSANKVKVQVLPPPPPPPPMSPLPHKDQLEAAEFVISGDVAEATIPLDDAGVWTLTDRMKVTNIEYALQGGGTRRLMAHMLTFNERGVGRHPAGIWPCGFIGP